MWQLAGIKCVHKQPHLPKVMERPIINHARKGTRKGIGVEHREGEGLHAGWWGRYAWGRKAVQVVVRGRRVRLAVGIGVKNPAVHASLAVRKRRGGSVCLQMETKPVPVPKATSREGAGTPREQT